MRITLFFIFLMYALTTNAQTYSFNKEVISVYKAILKDGVRKPYTVQPRTFNREFKKINFKQPGQHLVNPDAIGPLNSSLWKDFLLSIDTAQIKDYDLRSRYFKRLNKNFNKASTRKRITFTSPVFSNNYELCVCYIDSYTSPENAIGLIYFLEKKDNKWIVVKDIMAYIS